MRTFPAVAASMLLLIVVVAGLPASTGASFVATTEAATNTIRTGALDAAELNATALASGGAQLSWSAAPTGGASPEYALTRRVGSNSIPTEVFRGTDTTFTDVGTPPPPSGVIAVAGGDQHTLALTVRGAVWAFGGNGRGQLGDGTTVGSSVPVRSQALPGNRTVVAIAGGALHSLALAADGTVWAWGDNRSGQLGDGTTVDSSVPVQVRPPSDDTAFVAIAAGTHHSLALAQDGTVWVWGHSLAVQVAGASTGRVVVPVQVPLGGRAVTAIAAGGYHSLALAQDGSVWAWGSNNKGQLGVGFTTLSAPPLRVSAPWSGLPVTAIAAGSEHSMALTSDGTVWSWGSNGNGQLGTAGASTAQVPVAVGALRNVHSVTAIAAGQEHSLAISQDGTVWAWGRNASGQLGDGRDVGSSEPVLVQAASGGRPPIAVAAGADHSVMLAEDGTLWAWGGNSLGQLGNGSAISSSAPAQTRAIPSEVTFAAVAGGADHTVALASDGRAWAWGSNNYGQLGNDGTTPSRVPVQVQALPDGRTLSAIAAGRTHSIALARDGSVWGWGYNSSGELGNGSLALSRSPVRAQALPEGRSAVAITAGANYTMALAQDGTVWAWGMNDSNQLGNDSTTNSPVPVRVKDMFMGRTVTAIAAGTYHSIALAQDGTVWTWGANSSGQLGTGTTHASPVPTRVQGIPAGTVITAIAAGAYHSIALAQDGTAWVWGANSYGQLGKADTRGSLVPAQVHLPGGRAITAVSAGMLHSMALADDGTVWAWGMNSQGQLGTGTLDGSTVPVQGLRLRSGSTVATISAGADHSTIVAQDGTVWTWGANYIGQLGDDSTADSPHPVQARAVVRCPAGSTALPDSQLCSLMRGMLYQYALTTRLGGWWTMTRPVKILPATR